MNFWHKSSKRILPGLAACLFSMSVMSATCESSPNEARTLDFDKESLEAAKQNWQSTAHRLNNSYTYIRVQGSMTGETYVTLVRFENSELTARIYKRLKVGVKDGKRHVEIREAWMATKGMKRLFGGEGGFPGLSMEELYDACESEVLKRDAEKNHVGLAADDRGVLKRCYYSPKMCADDCGKSYDVSHFYPKSISDEILKEYVTGPNIELKK